MRAALPAYWVGSAHGLRNAVLYPVQIRYEISICALMRARDRGLSRLYDGWAFPGRTRVGPMELRHPIAAIFNWVQGMRAHDLRSAFASVGADELGYADSTMLAGSRS